MALTYPIRFAAQMREHLRALRKRRGMTQAQLGAQLGVSQARIAEIEANPGLVSFDQLLQLLSHLGSGVLIEEPRQAQAVSLEAVDDALAELAFYDTDDSQDEDEEMAEHYELLREAIDDAEAALDEDEFIEEHASSEEPAQPSGHYAFRKKKGSW